MSDQIPTPLTSELIKTLFDDVHQSLQSESGYGLDAQTRNDAWRQVQLYWMKLHDAVAGRVTETEVPLTLMNNVSEGGRLFTIHGIVDVVQAEGEVILYDIKSHDYKQLHDNIESYGPQLRVYAHIWSQLRDTTVHQTCIINTDPPAEVKRIVDYAHMTPEEEHILEQWKPVIPIQNYNAELVQETIAKFGRVVDSIEERKFAPPSLDNLRGRRQQLRVPLMCAKCDARYSCSTYRQLSEQTSGYHTQAMRFYESLDSTRAVYEAPLERYVDEDGIEEELAMFQDDAAANTSINDDDDGMWWSV